MDTRENLHRMIDTLQDDQVADLLDYVADRRDNGGPLSKETRTAVEESIEDYRHGRTISLAEYRPAGRDLRYEIQLSNRARKDLDRLNDETAKRAVRRLEQIAEAPTDHVVVVSAVERRGQVYGRI